MTESCVLCSGSAGEMLFENDAARVLLHPDWAPRGHLMIVAREHFENASNLSEERWLALTRVWHQVEKVLLELTGAQRCIVMKLGIQTPHLHVHLYPVSADASRANVFALIDGHVHDPEDAAFVAELRRRLTLTVR